MAIAFLDKIEEAVRELKVLSAHEERPIPNDLSEDVARSMLKRMYEDSGRLRAELLGAVGTLERGVKLARELDLAKDPDVERLASEVFSRSYSSPRPISYDNAHEIAVNAIKKRNELRNPPPTPSTK